MDSIDLREEGPPIAHQRGLESCVAIAYCDAIWWAMKRVRASNAAAPLFRPSAMFVYYNARKLKGWHNLNTGVQPSEMMQAIERFGVCPEELWPYNPRRYRDQPSSEAYRAAEAHREFRFEELPQKLESLFETIDAGIPFLCCLRLFPSNHEAFYNGETSRTGILRSPKPFQTSIYNHAMVGVSYNPERESFTFRNSFGAQWGDSGHVKVSGGYVVNPSQCFELRRVNSSR